MTDGARLTGNFKFDRNTKREVGINSDNKEITVSLDNIVWFVTHETNFLSVLNFPFMEDILIPNPVNRNSFLQLQK